MSQEQKPRRRAYKSRMYPEACDMVSEYQELSTLAPEEIKRLCGHR
jgi:hypothetical protein